MEESLEVYECVNCLRPVLTGYCGESVAGEFAAEEEFLVFMSCFRVVISPESSSFNGNTLCSVSCRCEQELGYFLPHYRNQRIPISTKNFIARIGSVKARVDACLTNLTKYVENEARYAQSLVQKCEPMAANKSLVVSDSVRWVEAYAAGGDDVAEPIKRRRRDGNGYGGLVEDVMFEEILPRLPLESLRSFKVVSREWRHCIVSNSHFISNHLRRCSEKSSSRLSIIIMKEYPRHRMLFVNNDKVEMTEVTIPVKKCAGRFTRCRVVGSCDGLVCLWLRCKMNRVLPVVMADRYHQAIVLWNPETGQVRDAGLPPPFLVGLDGVGCPAFGFGCDRSHGDDDYKVVRVVAQSSFLKFDIFSRKTGCWRVLEKGLEGCELYIGSTESALVDARLYWLVVHAASASSPRRLCVLWFDLNDEEFGILDVLNLPEPRESRPEFPPHYLVKWKDNSLAFLQFPNNDAREEEYHFRVILDAAAVVAPKISVPHDVPWRLCGVSRDRIFVEDRKRNLMMYDFETGVARPQKIFSTSECSVVGKAHDYVPSLVSVYPDFATMARDAKKMKVRFWVGALWEAMGFVGN